MPAQPHPSPLISEHPKKIFYIDNLKVLLTALVVLHHSFITYGASGGWYYAEKTTRLGALIPMTMFVSINQAGLLAYKNNWLSAITYRTGKRMALLATLLVLFLPVFYIIKLKIDMPLAWYSGGFHWQALLYAVWEQVIGFSIITALLVFGRELWNKS